MPFVGLIYTNIGMYFLTTKFDKKDRFIFYIATATRKTAVHYSMPQLTH